jgi:enoyl-CoA hydratase/carnithine racemase
MKELMQEKYSRVAVQGPVLTVTIARPSVRNALHPAACAEIGAVLDWYETEASLRVAIITGEGEQAFCAGFDLQYAQAHPEVYEQPLIGSELVRRQDRSKPLIAAVNGLALGLGFELALACDLVIAAEHAQFGLPEPRVGLAAMGGGVVRLTRQIGCKRAMALILTGRMSTARDGHTAGFVNEVVSQAGLMESTRRWADDIVKGAPLSIAASKRMAYDNFDMPLAAALDPRNYPAVRAVLASGDAHEGRQAFIEKRSPAWRGC